MTLLELVVVLTILVILGTAIITNTTGVADQARYNQTITTLESLRDAVLGREPGAGQDPTATPLGFVADVGRLPLPDVDLGLSELWDHEASDTPATVFAVHTLTGLDDDLKLACGWRGPYVRRPLGADDIRDGWGRGFELLDSAGFQIGATSDPIAAITSPGSGVGDAYDVALDDVVFVDTVATPSVDLTTGQIAMQLVFNVPVGQYAVVRLYGPINGGPAVVAQSGAFAGTGAATSVSVTFGSSDVPIGPKILRAYQWTSATPPGLTDDLSAVPLKSVARRVTVLHGGSSWPDLELGDVD